MGISIKPYKKSEKGKKEQIADMFDNISGKYDFLNRLLSLGIDVRWRKQVLKKIKTSNAQSVLDVATGTGDLAIMIAENTKANVTGIDLSSGMLENGRKKIRKKALDQRIEMIQGDCENLPFKDNSFDAVTVSFGVRNFENLFKGLKEIYRVIKPKGTFVILEFAQPERLPAKQLYGLYAKRILPTIGRFFSKDNDAYRYLPESVAAFPYGSQMIKIITESNFRQVKKQSLTFGVAMIYIATK